MISKQKLKEELQFCLNLWQTNGGCTFGNRTFCENCAVPYLLYKLITGEILHGKAKRLSLEEWQKKLEELGV